jgi:diguanylate cyclase (GGDEF)-like protein/PAS domain S-box-containing protein
MKLPALHSLKTRVTLLTLACIAVGFWSIALYFSHVLRGDMQKVLGEQQLSTVTGMALEIDGRLHDRVHALETVAQEITPAVLENAATLQTLLERHTLLQLLFNGGVFVTRADGTAIADVPASSGRIGTNYIDRESVSTPLKEGRAVIGRPAMGKKLGAPVFSIAAPLKDKQGQVIGVLVGTINLGKPNFLDQIAQTRYGKTGGYLLIAPQHQLIVTATDKTRVMQAAPPPGVNAMHDHYMQGFEGFGTATNSRGVLELSAAKRVPSAGWFLAAALPAKEAFEPIDNMLQSLFVSSFVFTVLVGLLTGWLISGVLRRQFAPMLVASRAIAERTDADRPIEALPVLGNDEIGELIAGFNVLLENYARREELLKAEESFKSAILNSLDAQIAVVDRQGVIQSVNARWVQFSFENSPIPGQATPDTGVGTSYLGACRTVCTDGKEEELEVHRGLQAVLDGRLSKFTTECPCDSPQQQRWFAMTAMPLGQGAVGGAVITHVDITERKQAEVKLQLAASVFSQAREGIIITDAEATILDVNEAFTRITGYTHGDVVGKRPSILHSGRQSPDFYVAMWGALMESGHWSGEIWNRRKNGEVYAELLNISAVPDASGKTQQYVALFSDITAIKTHQSQLEHIAHFDALTGLPNRVLLADRLQQAMLQTQRRDKILAVVYLDLDGFKSVNDSHGHHVGDQLLIALANAMSGTLREGDTLARIGGDEFVAVLIDLDNTASCMPMLTRLLEAAATPILLAEKLQQCSASVGVTFYPQAVEIEADQLLRQSDQAMYQAKLAGKNRFHVFDPALDSDIRGHHESLQRIRLALKNREFVLHYQPKVNLHSGQVIGAEALIRWEHPDKGLLAPSTFLPVIEDHALAVDVGEWVIDMALTQLEVWHAAGLDLPVSVNIGSRQLQQDDFMQRLKALLARHPSISPGQLELEVLETSAMADMSQVSQVIDECTQLGVRCALDDFGTGYSSLTYLKRLRVAILKIDQSFVRDMLDDPDDLAILQGVIGLAEAFRHEVIAEGVETVAHGTALLQLGCELAQGFGIARPMPPELLPDWVAAWQPDAAWRLSQQSHQ